MKILITTDLFTTDTNGVVTSVRNLLGELEQKGHDVRVLTLSDNIHSHKDGNIYYIRSMPLGIIYPDVRMPLSYHHKLIKELIKWKPDVIHSQCEFFSYQFALYVAKKTGAPIVHTYHTLYEQYVTYVIPAKRFGAKMVRTFSRKRLKKASAVIAPTHKVENTLRYYGLKNQINVVPSGISLDQHKIRISNEVRAEKRKELGIKDGETVLINLGRLGTEKNLEEIVHMYDMAVKKFPTLRLMFVGGGPAKEGLEKLSKKLGLEDKVIFTGMVPPTKVQEYYQLGDVFVSASTSETQGLTYVEAAANGLPLLCREDLCHHGVLIEGENGYTYTDENGFISGIGEILKNPKWIETASEKSRNIAETFDKKHFGDAVESVYASVK